MLELWQIYLFCVIYKNDSLDDNIDVVNIINLAIMNIHQFKYILAVAEKKHFAAAADKCCITQSTLSTMISRFEEEIGIKVFNRKTKPVSITEEGKQIIERLQIINKEIAALNNVVQELKGEMKGELRIGIIPTIAPYLLPLFLSRFAEQFPKVKVIVQELTTPSISLGLKRRTLDIGILAIPLEDPELEELNLYTEPFVIYDCTSNRKKTKTSIQDLDYSKLWYLEEGHCLRTQVQRICEISNKQAANNSNIEFKAGSIDSLLRFTKVSEGITILPYLATLDLSIKDQERLQLFADPVPVRTVGIVTHQFFVKKSLLDNLQKLIVELVEPKILKVKKAQEIKPV